MRELNHYIYEFGPFQLDATKRVLLKEGKPLKLFPKEFDTLLALVEHKGEVLNKDDLMRQVWHDAIVEESNLTTNISHLRKLLGENRGSHEYIVTVPGRGYRFVAGVKLAVDEVIIRNRTTVTIEEEECESVEQSTEVAVAEKPVTATTPVKWFRSGKLLIAVGVVLLTIAAFGLYRFKNRAAAPFNEINFTRLTNSGRATLATMSPDGRYIVHVAKGPEGESLWLRQVATESNVQIAPPAAISYWGLIFSPDGEFIYCVTAESNKGDTRLSMIPVLGGAPRRLPVGPHGPDGRYLVLSSDRGGTFNLWRVEMRGGDLVRLTDGEGDVSPRFSPDGRWIVYQRGFPTGARIWRVPVDGGKAEPLTQTRGQRPDVSPDGKLIGYHSLDSELEARQWIFGVMSFEGGPLINRFSFPPTVEQRMVRWVPGGWGLAYLDSAGGVSNVWVQPLDGGQPWQLYNFKSGRIDSFDWSADGRWLAFVRGSETSDVVLIQSKSE